MTNTSNLHYKPLYPDMTIIPMEENHAKLICAWRYPSPYNSYNWAAWDKMKKNEIEFGDPVLRQQQYAVIVDPDRQLIAYVQFFPFDGVTRLGLGIEPSRCGLGLGPIITRIATTEALRREPLHEIDLEVWTWNVRAIRAYEKAGFYISDTYDRPVVPNQVDEEPCSDEDDITDHFVEYPLEACHCMVFSPQE